MRYPEAKRPVVADHQLALRGNSPAETPGGRDGNRKPRKKLHRRRIAQLTDESSVLSEGV